MRANHRSSPRPLVRLSAGATLWIGGLIGMLMTYSIYLFVTAGR